MIGMTWGSTTINPMKSQDVHISHMGLKPVKAKNTHDIIFSA